MVAISVQRPVNPVETPRRREQERVAYDSVFVPKMTSETCHPVKLTNFPRRHQQNKRTSLTQTETVYYAVSGPNGDNTHWTGNGVTVAS